MTNPQSVIKTISKLNLFEGLSDEQLSKFTACSSMVQFSTDEYIFRQNDEANKFYILQSGLVNLSTYLVSDATITLQTVGPFEILGLSWIVSPYVWHFDAKVTEPVQAIEIDAACARESMDKDHNMGYVLMQRFFSLLVQRLQNTRLQLLDIYEQSTTPFGA